MKAQIEEAVGQVERYSDDYVKLKVKTWDLHVHCKINSRLKKKNLKHHLSCKYFLTCPVIFLLAMSYNSCTVKLFLSYNCFSNFTVHACILFFPPNQLIWTCMFPFPASPRPEWCSDGQTEGGERGPQSSGMNWSSKLSGPYKCQNLTLISIFCLKIVFTLFKLRMNSFPFSLKITCHVYKYMYIFCLPKNITSILFQSLSLLSLRW